MPPVRWAFMNIRFPLEIARVQSVAQRNRADCSLQQFETNGKHLEDYLRVHAIMRV